MGDTWCNRPHIINEVVVSWELLFRKFDGRRIVVPDEATAPCSASCPLQLDILGRRVPVRIRKQGPPPALTQSAAGYGNVAEAPTPQFRPASPEVNGTAGPHINSGLRIAEIRYFHPPIVGLNNYQGTDVPKEKKNKILG